MAEETKISQKLTVKDIGIVLDDRDTISTVSHPIPARQANQSDIINTQVTNYKFGINNLHLKYDNATVTSGVLSKIIQIGKCDYVTLNTSLHQQRKEDYYGVEFSIVDNNNEKPIIPYNQSQVIYEKLYLKLPLRFQANKTTPIVVNEVTKDGIVLYNTYNNLSDFEKDRSVIDDQIANNKKDLVVSYVPTEGKRIAIDNDKIYLKIIKHVYVGNMPVKIKNIIINAHGGKLEWKI
nr:MAG TPA: hypothetical protein [Caudoviricetes sp.]